MKYTFGKICFQEPSCAGFGWDVVNFPQSSPYSAVFWIC